VPGTSNIPSRPVPQRSLSLFSAVIVGVAAMVGTGVFVAWQPAYQLAGSQLLLAVAVAAVIAILNAISNARLARAFPESGGGYIYGRECINPFVGQIAGWSFLIGKLASASAASLAIGAYLAPGQERIFALMSIAAVLLINISGIKFSVIAMTVMITVVLSVLLSLSVGSDMSSTADIFIGFQGNQSLNIFAAAGIMFVAFAGYARIAVLGSEVKNPTKVIPLAITLSLALVVVLYVVIAVVLLGNAAALESVTPILALAEITGYPLGLVSIAAVLAAGSALFALIAGLGRMVFSMSSGGHLPASLAVLTGSRAVPIRADLVVGLVLIAITLIGSIAFNLAISALFVLTYYAVVHVASWKLTGRAVLTRFIPITGLLGNGLVVGALIVLVVGDFPVR
jgi:APA family basic amino acid/polyamine antiporter